MSAEIKKSNNIALVLSERERKRQIKVAVVIFLVVFSLLFRVFSGYHQRDVEAGSSDSMNVNISQYISQTNSSSYYKWAGRVNISGEISQSDLKSDRITGYLNNSAVSVFSVEKTKMSLSGGKYSFSASFDTSSYPEGLHTLRIYDGQVNTVPDSTKTPLFDFPVHIDNEPFARVNANSNLRTGSTTSSSIILTVPANSPVEVTGQEKGMYAESFGTDIWYKVRYTTPTGTVHNGYILSSLVSVRGLSGMNLSFPGVVTDSFDPVKREHEIDLPYSASSFTLENIVRPSDSDKVNVIFNEKKIDPPYKNIPLKTGDNSIKVELIRGSGSSALGITYKYNIWRISESVEAEFQAQLKKFPESYRNNLLALHSKYPNWLFVAHETDLDWNYTIDNQDKGTVSLIFRDLPREYYKFIKKDAPANATFSEFIDEPPRDGTSFYTASREAIEYHMDPRNFLTESRIFQFEQLSYNSAVHTIDGLKRIFANSGHAGKESMFLNAGQISKVSPYHLASRSRLELGNPLSIIATGTYSKFGGKYLGRYNFYNIGTGSSTDQDVLLSRGLEFALGNYWDGSPRPLSQRTELLMPWNTEQKAITGGAIFIGNNYINRGQDTLYYQKFNPNVPGVHQYMQNIRAPFHESISIFNAYRDMDSLSANILFKIPVYKNMPVLPAPRPDDSNKLKSLSVSGTSLSPSFDPDNNGLYRAVVPYETERVTLSALAFSSKASVTGTGQKNLVTGDNNFTVRVSPANGINRDYQIRITRMPPSESNDNTLKELSVNGFEFDRNFSPSDTGPYTVVVPVETEHIDLEAQTSSKLATLTGTGKKYLNDGINDYSVTVTAQDGTGKIYRVRVKRIPETEISETRLESLSVENVSFSPAFSSGVTGTYRAQVPAQTSKIRITGKTLSSFSSVTGLGEKNLKYGKNEFLVRVTASDNSARTYRIEVTRNYPDIPEDNIVVNENTISGLSLSTTAGELKEILKTPLVTYRITDRSKKELKDGDIVGTGAIVEVHYDGKKQKEYRTIIFGDLNGDGRVDSTDVALLRAHILRIKSLENEFLAAADVNGDGNVNSTDVAVLRAHILRINQIKQKF